MALLYLAVIKRKIECLVNSWDTSLDSGSRETLEFAYKEMESLEDIGNRMFYSSRRALEKEIKAALRKLKGVVESPVSKRIVSRSEISRGDGIQFSRDLQDLKQDVHFFTETLKKMEEEYIDALYNSSPEEKEEENDAVSLSSSSRIGSGGNKYSKMVGLSDLYNELKSKLIIQDTSFKVFSVIGMAGIGKTTLAKKIFEDPDIVEHFDCRVWVTLGRKCQLREILRCILAQVNFDIDYQMLMEGDDEDIGGHLKESLKGKKYLIVLDDVWGKHMAYLLQRSYKYRRSGLRNPFPDKENGSRVLLTTRLQQVSELNQLYYDDITMRLLDKEESWDLFREKVFGQELCPSQLEKAGKKIAENCEGHPLTIITVAHLLSTAEKSPQYWSKVAADKNDQLFMAAYDEISKVLLPSYKYLPGLLQMCFLYMGIFPQNYDITRSKLINMWKTDGFLELNVHKFPYPDAMECLEELVLNSLVMVSQRTTDPTADFGGKQIIKTCGLHSSLWYLSNREARKAKFSHALSSRRDGLGEGIKSQCRLSFHNNILFGIKDVYKSVEDKCASTARSLLFYGPYHQYQVPICFDLKLLRELDALTIRFYEFPMEALQLVQLRYLALTLNGKLPASISQLSNLQFLIIDRHLSIKSSRDPSNLPVEIWNMKELLHLQVMGSDLPDPCGASLKSLSTLSNVSAHSCTEGVLKAVPCLQKLGIRIELAPDDDAKSLSCFDHISQYLKTLKSLKCVIRNPDIVPPPASLPIFPSYLEKLSLSGLGYPWKEMSKIASLINLNVLKLQNYAFRGPVWEVKEKQFISLISLVIEDTDLVDWKIEPESFLWLQHLSIKHCYKLERIHGEFDVFLEKIEADDCNPLAVDCLKQYQEARIRKRHILPEPDVNIHSSWDDGKLKI